MNYIDVTVSLQCSTNISDNFYAYHIPYASGSSKIVYICLLQWFSILQNFKFVVINIASDFSRDKSNPKQWSIMAFLWMEYVHNRKPVDEADCRGIDRKHLSRLMSKPTKWSVRSAKTQISTGIHPVWSESSQCTKWVTEDPMFFHADSEDSDQTGWMPRLIWVFAWRQRHFVSYVMLRLICSSPEISWGASQIRQVVRIWLQIIKHAPQLLVLET